MLLFFHKYKTILNLFIIILNMDYATFILYADNTNNNNDNNDNMLRKDEICEQFKLKHFKSLSVTFNYFAQEEEISLKLSLLIVLFNCLYINTNPI